MPVIMNCWVEKVKKKKSHQTAPAYESYKKHDDFKTQTRMPESRHTPSLKVTCSKTLRGTRK